MRLDRSPRIFRDAENSCHACYAEGATETNFVFARSEDWRPGRLGPWRTAAVGSRHEDLAHRMARSKPIERRVEILETDPVAHQPIDRQPALRLNG